MNWIQENKLLAGISGVTLVLVLVLGWLAFSGYSAAGKAQKDYAKASTELSNLFGKKLYPSPENLKAKSDTVKELQDSTTALRAELAAKFSATEAKDPATFGQRVQSQFQDLRKLWDDPKTKMTVPDNFFLGMDDYRRQVAARPGTVRDLDYQLGAITEVLEMAVSCGIKSLDAFERAPVLEEKGPLPNANEKKGELPPPLVNYRLTLRCTGQEQAVRDLVNAIATSQKHFYAIRVVRMQNEKKTAPKKEDVRKAVKPAEPAPGGPGDLFAFPPADGAAAAPMTDAEKAMAAAAGQAVPGGAKPEEAKPVFAKPAPKDASEILGKEQVKAYLQFDLVVFRPAPEAPAEGAAKEKKATN